MCRPSSYTHQKSIDYLDRTQHECLTELLAGNLSSACQIAAVLMHLVDSLSLHVSCQHISDGLLNRSFQFNRS